MSRKWKYILLLAAAGMAIYFFMKKGGLMGGAKLEDAAKPSRGVKRPAPSKD